MPLSEQEQRLLEEMERNLYKNDADFVATVGGAGRGRAQLPVHRAGHPPRRRRRRRAHRWGGTAAPRRGSLGFALMFAGVLIAITPVEARLGSPPFRPSPARREPRRSGGGFMDRLNDRWDRRQDGRD